MSLFQRFTRKFCQSKHREGQTYMEFARQKEMLFNRWCNSQQIEKLKQLILLEEFKNCVPVPIKTYLEEQKVEELHRAATLTDDYKLTHKNPANEVKSDTYTSAVTPVSNSEPTARK